MQSINSIERSDIAAHVLRCLDSYRSLTGTPGVVAAVMCGQRELCQVSSGWRDVRGTQRIQVDDRFQAGSISKMATAVLALRAVRDGLLDLHAPISDRVPSLARYQALRGVSLHHLLSHTGGLPLGMCLAPTDLADLQALGDDFESRAGSSFYYSNLGYNVIGHALAAVYEATYPSLAEAQLLQPLGMLRTSAQVSPHERLSTAEGHTWAFDDRPHGADELPIVAPWPITALASENLISTVGDLAKFGSALVSCDGRIIDSSSLQQMLTPHAAAGAFDYGYGACLYPGTPGSVFGHTGSMLGYRGVLLADRESQLVVAILSNMAGADMASCMGRLGLELVRSISGLFCSPSKAKGVGLAEVPSHSLLGGSDVERFSGCFHSSADDAISCEVHVSGSGLELCLPGRAIQLLRRDEASFLPVDSELGRYVMHFEMHDGKAAGFTIGNHRFVRTDPSVSTEQSKRVAAPSSHCGVYRSNNPWMPRIEVLTVDGVLVMHSADVICPLVRSDRRPSLYQLESTPELIEFFGPEDAPSEMARLSGLTFYRTSERSGLANDLFGAKPA